MSRPNFIAVPFQAESSQGFYEFRGIAKFSSAGVVVEYESKLLGLYGDEVKEVRLSLDDIIALRFRKGIFKFFSSIEIRIDSVSKFGGLPNSGGRFKMKLKREDWELGQRAVEYLNAFLLPEDFPGALNSESIEQLEGSPVDRMIEESSKTDKFKTNDLNETRKLNE